MNTKITLKIGFQSEDNSNLSIILYPLNALEENCDYKASIIDQRLGSVTSPNYDKFYKGAFREISIPRDKILKIFDIIKNHTIPIVVDGFIGLDGTTFSLSFEDDFSTKFEIRWWVKAPTGWEIADVVKNAIIELLDINEEEYLCSY